MLVKIIAMGLSAPVWKNVFHHLRTHLPQHPFAAGIFTSSEELQFLLHDYFPAQWRREEPDFLLCEMPSGSEGQERLAFYEQIQAHQQAQQAASQETLVMVLPTVEHGMRQLIQGQFPIRVVLDNQASFALSDPGLILRSFPAEFPRVRLNDHVTALRIRQRRGNVIDAAPHQLKPGTLIGFSELESIIVGEDTLGVEEWLRRTLRKLKVRMPKEGATGLIRESKGLFLFPGIPSDRIRGVTVGAVTFGQVLDIGQLTDRSPHFVWFSEALQGASRRQARHWRAVSKANRLAETKRDLPIFCGGGVALLNETLAAHLRALGFARVAAMLEPEDGQFREPALVIQSSAWAKVGLGNQVEVPDVVYIGDGLAPGWSMLAGLPSPGLVAFDAADVMLPELSPADFTEQKSQVQARGGRVEAGLGLAEKRQILLRQEVDVLEGAVKRLAELLEAGDTLQIWSGALSQPVKQVLVFSHDQEEAGAVLQALVGVPKKRWFDLAPFNTPEAIRNLSLEPVREYVQNGLLVITMASRDRLKEHRKEFDETLAAARQQLAEADEALRFYREEAAKTHAASHQLTRRWVSQTLQAWLMAGMAHLVEQMEQVRHRNERQWFSRALISRVVMVSSMGENRPALLEACRELYPRFSEELSVAVPYDFEPLDALPAGERADVVRRAQEDGANPQGVRDRIQAELERQNDGLFQSYLEVITTHLQDLHADLLLIEHRSAVAGRLLEHIREHIPTLRNTPAVLVVPDYWSPAPQLAMPWPLTRVIVLRRMGAIVAQECVQLLRGVHPA
jgi:hypothetical protein